MTATTPDRPSLAQPDWRPDVLARLVEWHRLLIAPLDVVAMQRALREDIADAMNVISGLRASNEVRLRLINEAKGERDEARARVAELEAAVRTT